jgi:hypothetical protein
MSAAAAMRSEERRSMMVCVQGETRGGSMCLKLPSSAVSW